MDRTIGLGASIVQCAFIGGGSDDKLNPILRALVGKSSKRLVKNLKFHSFVGILRVKNAMNNRHGTFRWKYFDKSGTSTKSVIFDQYVEHVFESKLIGTKFKIYPDEKKIQLDLFYLINLDDKDKIAEIKKQCPPWMTMYYLQSYADYQGYEIVIPQDISADTNSGASYYATNYGFYPKKPGRPKSNLVRKPCSDKSLMWIDDHCTDTLEQCLENATKDDVLTELKKNSCWTETNDILLNLGNSAVDNRKNKGFTQMNFLDKKKSRYEGEFRKFLPHGQGSVTTPDRSWRYEGTFENGMISGQGVLKGPGNLRGRISLF